MDENGVLNCNGLFLISIGILLSFTTPELLTNNRVRISQKYEGEPSVDMVQNILRNELNSKKEFYYEKTSNNFKMIAMNQRPFDFINKLGISIQILYMFHVEPSSSTYK